MLAKLSLVVKLFLKTEKQTEATLFKDNNSLAKFVCNVGEISLLPVINHHAQAVRVAVGSWYETKHNREDYINTTDSARSVTITHIPLP